MLCLFDLVFSLVLVLHYAIVGRIRQPSVILLVLNPSPESSYVRGDLRQDLGHTSVRDLEYWFETSRVPEERHRIAAFCPLYLSFPAATARLWPRTGGSLEFEPDPSHPTARAPCAKGNPDPGWRRITWDEALDETAAVLRRIGSGSPARRGPSASSMPIPAPASSATPNGSVRFSIGRSPNARRILWPGGRGSGRGLVGLMLARRMRVRANFSAASPPADTWTADAIGYSAPVPDVRLGRARRRRVRGHRRSFQRAAVPEVSGHPSRPGAAPIARAAARFRSSAQQNL